MANITIYLPDAVEKKVRKAAKSSKQPVSRWISDQLARSLDAGWPSAFLEAAGSMPDFPEMRTLRTGYGKESPRQTLK